MKSRRNYDGSSGSFVRLPMRPKNWVYDAKKTSQDSPYFFYFSFDNVTTSFKPEWKHSYATQSLRMFEVRPNAVLKTVFQNVTFTYKIESNLNSYLFSTYFYAKYLLLYSSKSDVSKKWRTLDRSPPPTNADVIFVLLVNGKPQIFMLENDICGSLIKINQLMCC